MVTRATAPPADGNQQLLPRPPAVNLPSIHDLNLGSEMAREAAAQPSYTTRVTAGFATHLHNPSHSRPSLPHLPNAQPFSLRPHPSSESFEQKDRNAMESAAPSPTQGVLNTPSTPSFPTVQVKDECPRCGAPLSSAQAECSCGHFRFIHPFQPHSRHLAAGLDESFHPGPMSRRGSGARSSFESVSCGSNPASRRGSCVAYPGIAKPAARRRSTAVVRKTSIQQELQKHNKADREKSSRRSLKHEHKKMEIRQQARGWTAATDLNSNNKKNSGLDGKKLEILQQTNQDARRQDLHLLNQYNNQRRLLQLLAEKTDTTAGDLAWMKELEREIEKCAMTLVKSLETEDMHVRQYFEREARQDADALDKERKGDRYPTPLSSSTSPSPAPTEPHC